jgi:hypothetical protein
MAGDFVLLAAFLVQAHPAAPALHEIIPHPHLEHGVDAREAVDHDRDEGTIALEDLHDFVGKRRNSGDDLRREPVWFKRLWGMFTQGIVDGKAQ